MAAHACREVAGGRQHEPQLRAVVRQLSLYIEKTCSRNMRCVIVGLPADDAIGDIGTGLGRLQMRRTIEDAQVGIAAMGLEPIGLYQRVRIVVCDSSL